MKKVIIIGAGIGGLGTAIKLAQKGFKVTVFEKLNRTGGRCGVINKDGHIFDTGPTMFLYPEIYRNFFKSIHENLDGHLKLIRADPTYLLNFPNGNNITLYSNLRKMRGQLELLEKGSFKNYLKFLKVAKKHYQISMENIINKNIKKPLDYFNLKNLFLMIWHNAIWNHHFFVSKFFKNKYLQAAFTFQTSYLSLNPYNSPSIFSQFTYMESVHGSYLPEGGMYKVIESLTNVALKNGVDLRLNSPVKKVLIKNKKACGILLSNGKIYKSDSVIVNADLTSSYKKLLPQNQKTKKLLKSPHSCSALIFHWGLNKRYPQLKTHNLFFTDSYRQGFEYVLSSAIPPSKPHFYIQAPSRSDLTRAPENQDTLTVMIPINRIHPDIRIDWKKYSSEVRKYILKRLIKFGLKDIEKNIKFEILHTPVDWQNHFNLEYGSVYGLHHGLTQLGYLRESRIHPEYDNLFFVGASNHPGSGLPTVLISATFTAEDVYSFFN